MSLGTALREHWNNPNSAWSRRSAIQIIGDYIICLTAKALMRIFAALPRRSALGIGRILADAVYWLDRRHRMIGMINLEIAFPRLSRKRKQILLRAAFQNFGLHLAEISRIRAFNAKTLSALIQYDHVNGLQNYLHAVQKGKGVIFTTAHFGMWELLPAAHATYGHPLRFVVRRVDNLFLDEILAELRRSSGNDVIEKRGAVRQSLKDLGAGKAVGMLIDQNTAPEEGIFTAFFGKPACCLTIASVLAARTGAPIVPGFLRYDRRRDRHQIIFLPELNITRTSDFEADVRSFTEAWNRVLESMIRRYPHMWMWTHRRWKTRPPDEAMPLRYDFEYLRTMQM